MSNKGKVKRKRINNDDKDAMVEEDVSIVVVIGLTVLFIMIGVLLGYILYKLALSSSAFISFNNLLK